jgi:glycosyltransferase involved in cell wall biosynthesis
MTEQGYGRNKLIALVSNSAWAVYNFRLDIIRYLYSQGYRILVVAPDDDYSPLLAAEGCTYVPVDFNNRSENPLRDLKLYYRLQAIYRRYRPDFIFHYVIKPNIYGTLAAAACSIQSVAVVTGLGYSFARKNWLYRTVRVLYKRALRRASEVWFLNNDDATRFANEGIVRVEKMKVLPGEGLNTEHFQPVEKLSAPNKRPFRFIMSTRLLRSKGISTYAAAAGILKKKQYSVELELIGFFEAQHPDSVHKDELKRWEQEGLLRYRGFVADVRPHLAQADCLVFPSYYPEGVPRCLLEAASMELPVITSLNPGCREVVLDNGNGFLCRVNDPFDLADKMEKMINLPEEQRFRMGKIGRSLVIRKFSISFVIEEYRRTLAENLHQSEPSA